MLRRLPPREASTSQPDFRYMPAIVEFLGYNPLPVVNTMAEKLVRRRTSLGMSQKEAAREIGVDARAVGEGGAGTRGNPLG